MFIKVPACNLEVHTGMVAGSSKCHRTLRVSHIRPISVPRFWISEGFDSSIILMLRGGIPRYVGNFPRSFEPTNLIRDNLGGEIGRLELATLLVTPSAIETAGRRKKASAVPCYRLVHRPCLLPLLRSIDSMRASKAASDRQRTDRSYRCLQNKCPL